MSGKKQYRSKDWYGSLGKDGFIHRSSMKAMGLPEHVFDGRPVIGICNTWSEFNPCNASLLGLAEAVKRGVWEAGGLPVEFPVSSLNEDQVRPTTMLFRNLLAMDVEEAIRSQPIDGVVLMGGCDKTTPGQLMGAASVDLPSIVVSAGPSLSGRFRGQILGSGTDIWRLSEEFRAGDLSLKDFMAAEAGIARSFGVCNTMGTASTMASLVETMGLSLPMNASLPAADSRRMALAHLSGMRIVRMVEEDLKISRVVSRNSFENAVIANAAFGGSTNAVVHLLALAKRLEIPFDLQDFELGADIPLLVNCMPSGTYLMEDFCYAGGVPVVLKELSHLLRDALTITGACIKEVVADAECFNTDVIRSFNSPVKEKAGIRVLRGNLVPNGAVIKPAAANENLLKHEGQALVFSSIEDMRARINDPALPVTADTVLVLQGCGPRGYPGMAEVGNLPIPARLLEAGVRDMVRISDARMSGTAYGTVVLHASPEAAVGGPIALVQSGDTIRLDVAGGSLELLVDEAELARRRANWVEPQVQADRGYLRLYQDHVLQAEEGADLDFLVGRSGASVSREAH